MTSAASPHLTGGLNTLVIRGRVDADRAELTPRGELVHGCGDVLARTLAELPAGVTRVDLDMADVHFMDTAGLQFLDVLGDFRRRRSLTVTVTNWNGQPRRILELAGLNTADPLTGPDSTEPAPAAPAASAVALERAERLHVLQEEVDQLRQAIASRPVIDQARGILMATHGCSSDQAWHILRETSQLSNTKLRDVAAAVTASAEADGPPPPAALRTALQTAVARRRRG
ncbi:ANTAR domain-containing protein [Streptomyces dubilierae]|uniref:ANTAR domain-containing protein n=1 Tax=Streptomyces dubilierae TaxID=3075533 RepID=A0ABU2PIE6_9ACTN|nr:ANTAR domain-containing protein [Streptomyces sp. DSM 41921]MDT0390525.1 ANTAR domain-containing protein [Streptomyces sp. DSM 41921]